MNTQLICDECGASLSLDSDQAVAAAQIITFVDAHARRQGKMAIRVEIQLAA